MNKSEFGIEGNRLVVGEFELDWPAIKISIGGKIANIIAAHTPLVDSNKISQKFTAGSLKITVSICKSPKYFIKRVVISSEKNLPTPDYVDVDIQTIPDPKLSQRGYIATAAAPKRQGAEEEGGGLMPGCGYPLIGRQFFVGLEHQAAFNTIEEQNDQNSSYRLRHYPQWCGQELECVDAVFGISSNPEEAFHDYLDEIRLPTLKKPLFSFCSFWSDPYIGNYEYEVNAENYLSFVKAFHNLGLRPDVYTLDAGWQNRQTIFEGKASFGGDQGLIELRHQINQYGSDLSLWLSHNGPMGIAPEYLNSLGIETGAGESSTYCGDAYGVLMDEKLEKLLCERFCQLAGPEFKSVMFKIDWDNDCATNEKFAEKYPTRNHVRQASINVMNRIVAAMRLVNPDVIIRNGWWPSPWWLCHATHFFLPDSGDSEYSMLPAKNQRASSATHRDIQYYNTLRRDRSAVPLDCIDNHEFPHALRNPFVETPAAWVDNLWLAVMRGSTYFPFTLQPESLEDWQAKTMRAIMEFSRRYADKIFVPRGKMILGHPGKGEIYGFLLPSEERSWCLLRNPLPLPQRFKFNATELAGHSVKSAIQFYPDFRHQADNEIVLGAHEVKVFTFEENEVKPLFEHPFQIIDEKLFFPASTLFNAEIRPDVAPTYQIAELKFSEQKFELGDGRLSLFFKLLAPYRMRNFELQFKLNGTNTEKLKIQLKSSRYQNNVSSSYTIPVTEISFSKPGHGESKNPDGFPLQDARYFSAPAPQGGEAYYRLDICGGAVETSQLELWASGHEGWSRQALKGINAPYIFEQGAPVQHPDGFPLSIQCKFD